MGSELVLCLQSNQPDLQREAFSSNQDGCYRLQRISHHNVQNLSNLYNLYTLDRFHRDILFPKEKSDALWNNSLENSCIQYADQVVLIFEKALPVAFVSIRRNLETIALWNQSVDLFFLVGVSPKHRNKHLGTWVLQNAMEWSLEHTNYIETETQSCNYAALALYQRNGFKICNSRLTFHKWL
jgi:ribosomal protein S18 acetylase RimI-like enzyme